LEYAGHVSELNTRPLTAIAVAGLLGPLMDSVNMVNAPAIARERGIEVTEIKRGEHDLYQTLMKLTVITERQTRSVSGTLFGGVLPRLVDVNNIHIEAEVSPHMLYVINDDKPGFIGALGTTLGQAGVNIASFHLGRASAGTDAIALLSLDQPISEDVLAKVEALPHVRQSQTLAF
jgi:D-3-phosphoglycerate dehydrogenase